MPKVQRSKVTQEEVRKGIQTFVDALKDELNKKGRGAFVSRHEILGVVTEEYDELMDAVRDLTLPEVRDELLDVAVAAVFGVICIDAGHMSW